eukprot:365160-Chlamydomonas_euryale.AAC.1
MAVFAGNTETPAPPKFQYKMSPPPPPPEMYQARSLLQAPGSVPPPPPPTYPPPPPTYPPPPPTYPPPPTAYPPPPTAYPPPPQPPVMVCKFETPCPDGPFYYCQAGQAINGCQAVSDGLFPTVDCAMQCVTEEDAPYPVCDFQTPCPTGTFYHCTDGLAQNGCRIFDEGLFPMFDCASQCLSVKE